eukprot:668554-Pyramimonas_sp.AAC.1
MPGRSVPAQVDSTEIRRATWNRRDVGAVVGTIGQASLSEESGPPLCAIALSAQEHQSCPHLYMAARIDCDGLTA